MSEEATSRSLLLARRAAWEASHGEPYLAHELYVAAFKSLPAPERLERGIDWLESALELCVEYLDAEAEETIAVARLLLAASEKRDARAWKVLGRALSLRARRLWSQGDAAAAADTAREAETALKSAHALLPEDADAQATLGGLYKRMADWAPGQADAASLRRAALQAYEQAAARGRSAYALLNAIEYRVGLERREHSSTRSAGQAGGPSLALFASDAERAALEQAMFIRGRQFRRGEDRPWAAFDLARGHHYLSPNVPRFLADLEVAVEDARRVARSATDRWMVATAARSLRELHAAEVPIDGLEDGLLLLQRAVVDDRWISGAWGPLGHPEEFLARELEEVRAGLSSLLLVAARAEEAQARLAAFIAATERRWSQDDEERFQREVSTFLMDIEPRAKKALRALWKFGGKPAIQAASDALAPGFPLVKVAAAAAEQLIEGALAPRH